MWMHANIWWPDIHILLLAVCFQLEFLTLYRNFSNHVWLRLAFKRSFQDQLSPAVPNIQIWNRASEPQRVPEENTKDAAAPMQFEAPVCQTAATKPAKNYPRGSSDGSLFIGICWEKNYPRRWEGVGDVCSLWEKSWQEGAQWQLPGGLNTGRKWINKISWIKFNSWLRHREILMLLPICSCFFCKRIHISG